MDGKYPEGSKLFGYQLMVRDAGTNVNGFVNEEKILKNVSYLEPVEDQTVDTCLKDGYRFGTDEEATEVLAKLGETVEVLASNGETDTE